MFIQEFGLKGLCTPEKCAAYKINTFEGDLGSYDCDKCIKENVTPILDSEIRIMLEHYAYFLPIEVGVGKSKRTELCLAFPKSSWEKLWENIRG